MSAMAKTRWFVRNGDEERMTTSNAYLVPCALSTWERIAFNARLTVWDAYMVEALVLTFSALLRIQSVSVM